MVDKHSCAVIMLCVACSVVGCGGRPNDSASAPSGPAKPEDVDGEPVKPEVDDPGYWDKVTLLYERAKESGETSATNATDWIGELYESAKSSGETVATDTSEWVNELYEKARQRGETSASSAKEWVVEDIQQIGSWRYKTLRVEATAADIESELNALGAQRWECFWVDEQDGVMTFYFKRAGRSYLRHLPTKELIRILPLVGGGGEG